MAKVSFTRYFFVLLLINICYFRLLNGEVNKSFTFKNFGKGSKVESELELYGGARVVNGGESIEICGSVAFSAGRVVYKKPFKLDADFPRKMVSFSVTFVFSMAKENGGSLAFLLVPDGFPLNVFDGGSFGLLNERKEKFIGVEFDSFQDDKYGAMKDIHVGIDFGSMISVESRNLSAVRLRLKSGEKLQSWIDYEASSRRLEVRLGKFGGNRPGNPLLSCRIDLSQIYRGSKEVVHIFNAPTARPQGGEVVVGISASIGNSSQTFNIYSWSFVLRTPPNWMHSEPLDPNSYNDNSENRTTTLHKKSDCALRVLAALIFGTGCGALGAFVVLFMWTVFCNRRPVVPEDYALPTKEDGYKMAEVGLDKVIKDDVMK